MKTKSEKIRQRYDRLAPFFDGLEAVLEGLFFKRWRKRLWEKVQGEHILEVGVGTGKNFDFYPRAANMTAIDFSPAMLAIAQQKAEQRQLAVSLNLMDVELLAYGDNCFDTVVATFVFCSVPRPHKGLKELYRVCKPGGKVILLEHVLSSKPPLAWLMNALNPLVVALVGANINRQTLKSVQAIGFKQVYVDAISSDGVKLIEAVK
jgi:phosphatidylethanolamine/phosphatidyl-N-methylethanolamine N-methyltransferase